MKATLTQPDYRELIDNLSGVIYTTDIRGVIEFASAGVYALTGYTPEELVGQHFSFLVDPECLKKVYDHYENQVRTATRETTLEFFCLNAKGEKKWVEQTALLIDHAGGKGESGKVQIAKREKSFQCFVRDISEKRDVQRQLIAAKTDAEEARRLQEQFLANMSHEIRTPMNGIVGMTNLLLETKLAPQQEQFAGVIRRCADNLLVIIDDILDLSKIKAGKLNIEKIAFKLEDVTANIWSLFEQRIIKKGLQFRMQLDPQIPDSLIGDPHRLNQILINLVGNAAKFTENGSITLAVKLEKQTPKTAALLFTVTDTGIGIPPDQLPHIFDSFSQAAVDITRKYGGTGLGLTICHQLLTLQGGSIVVQSEPTKGTTFSFRIPYGYEVQNQTTQAQNNQENSHHAIEGKFFLVVEDNLINQQLIEYVIRKAGAHVTVANHGREAIEYLESQRYDLIIMDLQMPVMDGYETTNYLRNTMRLRTPVLAMTANALKGEQVRCLEVGMNGYMSKPFEFRDFYNRVAALLETGKRCHAPKDFNDQTAALFNLSLLEDIGDKDYVCDTISIFLETLPGHLQEFQQAFCEQDHDRLGRLAHKLKGTMGVFQAHTLIEQLDKIEQLARERTDPGGILPVTLSLLRQLDSELRQYDHPLR